MQMQHRTLRKIAAVVFSFFVIGALILISKATQKPGKGDELEAIIAFTLCIVGSSLILERKRIDRFWKTFLFSCFAGFFPTYLYIVVNVIRFGFVVYFWLGLMVLTALFIFSALCALPFVGLFYWHRGRFLGEQSGRFDTI